MVHPETNHIIGRQNKGFIYYNEGRTKFCENCQREYLLSCECVQGVRDYLESKFLDWTSGNKYIDDLIRKCQLETLTPNRIVEWIPYDRFQDIKYLTNSRYSEISTANWTGGSYHKWDSERHELRRYGTRRVILKKSIKSVEQNYFLEEAKSLLSMSSKWRNLVKCFGITQDPETKDYILVMKKMDIDLRKYLQQYHNRLSWRERINIVYIIIYSLSIIHKENAVHGDLHSGNILYKQDPWSNWYISDIAFRGPVNKPSKSIYGNLPYIAPEVIAGKECTFESDIYSIAMLMWEISSGQPPFNNYEHDSDVTMKIINGIRPKIVPETPLEYKKLMQQCWDADPSNRPDGNTLKNKIEELKASYKNDDQKTINLEFENLNQSQTNKYLKDSINNQIGNSSKIYMFKNLPSPKNAPENEQEDNEGNIYNNPNLHSEDQDELEIPEFDDMDELYNKGVNDNSNTESEKSQLDFKSNIENNNKVNENNGTDKNDNKTDESNDKMNKNNIEEDEKKLKNKKKFVGTVKGSINKISKFVKPNKKDKKYDKSDEPGIR